MRSTGESMGIDQNFGNAFYKAQEGAGIRLPDKGNAFISIGGDTEKVEAARLAKELEKLGFEIYATEGTQEVLESHGVKAKALKKISEGSPNAVDMIQGKDLHFVINVPKRGEKVREDEKKIRFAILDYDIPYVTTMAGARAAVEAMKSVRAGDIETRSLNDYFS
jgi:carbamoyl-phosphate synthase large subunit